MNDPAPELVTAIFYQTSVTLFEKAVIIKYRSISLQKLLIAFLQNRQSYRLWTKDSFSDYCQLSDLLRS